MRHLFQLFKNKTFDNISAITWGLLRATKANREAGEAIDSLHDTLEGNVKLVQSNESLQRDDLRYFREELLKTVIQQ